MKEKKLHYGYVIVVAAFIQYLISGGVIYGASGVFVVPVTTSMNISSGQFMLYMTFTNGAMAVAATLLAPKLLQKFRYTRIDAAAVISAGAGIILMGFSRNLIMFYIAGVLMGLGCCILTYLAAGTLIPRWFKMNQGSMIATVLIGTRLGGIVFNPIASKLINSPALFGLADSWRSTYLILGLILLIVGLPNALFILKDYPSDKGLRAVWEEKAAAMAGTTVQVSGVDSKVAVKSGSFVFYVLMIITWNLATTMYNYLSAYTSGTQAVNTAGFDLSGLVGSLAMIGALVGGFIIGSSNDRFGGHVGGIVAGAFGAGGLVIMLLGANSPVMILMGSACFGVYYAISGVQMPAMVNTMYGNKDYDKIFQAGAKWGPWFGAVAASLWGFVYDFSNSYTLSFILAAILCVLTSVFGVVAVLISKKLKDKWVTEEVKR